jgi:hypothetical protein
MAQETGARFIASPSMSSHSSSPLECPTSRSFADGSIPMALTSGNSLLSTSKARLVPLSISRIEFIPRCLITEIMNRKAK